MPDLKTRLSALLIQYRYTRSQKVLNEMVWLLEHLEDQKDFKIFKDFFINEPDSLKII